MSIGTVLGLLFGVGLCVLAIFLATDNPIMFVSGSSLILVVGGTLANAFISYQGIYVIRALRDAVRTLGHARVNRSILVDEVRRIVEWALIVKKGGVVALDKHIKEDENEDHLLRYGAQLVLSGYKPKEVRELLGNTIESGFALKTMEVEVLRNMASAAPAFGMVGTLVGLIIMLQSMGEDPGGLGKGLAMALLTTLYGVLLARLVFQPAGDKINHREEIGRLRDYLMLEGFVMLAEEQTPRYIRDRISSFLEPDLIKQLQSDAKGGAS